MVRLDAFWRSASWHSYEAAYGDTPGTRARLLAGATWQTRVVDLRLPEPELWRGVRVSYHALINRLKRDSEFRTRRMTGVQFLDEARALHRSQSGRDTRPLASWTVQADWLDAGTSLCVGGYLRGHLEAFCYVAVHGAWAYYFSAASQLQSTMAAMQWDVMMRLKGAGTTHYELGWQNAAQTDKERSIEFFRRGFGGLDYAFNEELV